MLFSLANISFVPHTIDSSVSELYTPTHINAYIPNKPTKETKAPSHKVMKTKTKETCLLQKLLHKH